MIVVAAVAGAVLLPAPASSGGGRSCDEPQTEGTGDRVEISRVCFGPTVLQIPPGERVTWVNRDPIPHVVAGQGLQWGTLEMLEEGDTFSAVFDAPGLYPYTCSLHPGMNGLVVVGDAAAVTSGAGAADGSQVSAPPGGQSEDAATAVSRASPAPVESAAPWKAAAFTGFALFGVAAFALLRRRRPRGAPAA